MKNLKTKKKTKRIEKFFCKLQFGASARRKVYEKIEKFIKNGVPITNALEIIYSHVSLEGKKPNKPVAIIVNEWRQQMLNGKSFSKAIAEWVPAGDLSVLEAGEVSGRLDKAIQDVLFINEASKKIKSALAGIIYPIFLVSVLVFYLYIFGTKVVPAFSAILPTSKWTGSAIYLAKMSFFVQHQLVYWIIGTILLLIIILNTMGTWKGRLRVFFDKIPPWSIYRLTVGCNFLVSLAALMTAGIPIPDALLIMSKTGTPWYKERLLAVRKIVLNGAVNIGEALKKTKYGFPDDEIIIDIQSYASLDGFEEMLDKISRQILEDTVAKIKGQIAVLQNVALVALGLVFMWLVSGVFALQGQVTQALGMH